MRKNIGFAAWMGDPASLLICEKDVPPQFKLLPGESVSHNQKTWSSWKVYTRTLGKAPALAALIPCIHYQFPGERFPGVQEELVEHYSKKVRDKKYKPSYKHPAFTDPPALYSFVGAWNSRRRKELRQLMRVLSGPCYYSNHSAASARIIKACTFKYVSERLCVNEKTSELEAAIKKSCIGWALSR